MADRVEDVVRSERYGYFDSAIELYLQGQVSLDDAVLRFKRLAGIAVVAAAEEQ